MIKDWQGRLNAPRDDLRRWADAGPEAGRPGRSAGGQRSRLNCSPKDKAESSPLEPVTFLEKGLQIKIRTLSRVLAYQGGQPTRSSPKEPQDCLEKPGRRTAGSAHQPRDLRCRMSGAPADSSQTPQRNHPLNPIPDPRPPERGEYNSGVVLSHRVCPWWLRQPQKLVSGCAQPAGGPCAGRPGSGAGASPAPSDSVQGGRGEEGGRK